MPAGSDHKQPYDAGHFSFLELIRILAATAGAAFAKGALNKSGIQAASKFQEMEFESFEAFERSIEQLENPIAQFEGQARHYGEGVFGLPACPFAAAISTYVGAAGALPEEYKEVTAQINRESSTNQMFRVGSGAAVSPFCAVHQPIRSAMGVRIRIGGKRLLVYQLGCKSGSGAKGFAEPLLQKTGVPKAKVEEILDDNMCCYCIHLED